MTTEVRAARVYIAGPMTGYPAFNFPAFHAAAAALRRAGYDVLSPAEMAGANPVAERRAEYMRQDIAAVLDADMVAVLPGWERSRGATLEVCVAREIGTPVHDLADLAERR